MGLLEPGEHFSPSKAKSGEYTARLREARKAADLPDPDESRQHDKRRKDLSPDEKLALLQQQAATLLRDRAPFAERLPLLRARAEFLGLTMRDGELLALLKAARRQRIHGAADGMLRPGDQLDITPDPWAWEGLVLRGALNLWIALPKVGKTSLAMAFLAAWHRHELAFLDRNLIGPCPPVLIVGNDQGQADWGRMLQAVGWLDSDNRLSGPLIGLAHSGCPIHLEPEGIDRIADIAQQHPGLIVLIDSLHASIAPLGLKEESPEVVEPIADLMEQLEPHGATVVLIHHASKGRSGEAASSASRGSTAIPALASQVLKIGYASTNQQDRRRTITTEGRGGLPQTLVVERDGPTWILHGGIEELQQERNAEEAVSKLSDRQADVLDVVCERWEDHRERSTALQVVAALAISGADPRAVILRSLKALERKGLLSSVARARPGEGGRLYEFGPTPEALATRTRAHAGGDPKQGSVGSVGSVGSLAREDPHSDSTVFSLQTLPTDPTDPKDQQTDAPPAREGQQTVCWVQQTDPWQAA